MYTMLDQRRRRWADVVYMCPPPPDLHIEWMLVRQHCARDMLSTSVTRIQRSHNVIMCPLCLIISYYHSLWCSAIRNYIDLCCYHFSSILVALSRLIYIFTHLRLKITHVCLIWDKTFVNLGYLKAHFIPNNCDYPSTNKAKKKTIIARI